MYNNNVTLRYLQKTHKLEDKYGTSRARVFSLMLSVYFK